MKFSPFADVLSSQSSPPAQGAWIEMRTAAALCTGSDGSPPAQGAWIEISQTLGSCSGWARRPLHRGRGLKSPYKQDEPEIIYVAPCTGGVD